MLNENFDNIFKSKLEGHSSLPGSDLWQNIESQLPNPSVIPFWSIGKLITVCIASSIIATGSYIFFKPSKITGLEHNIQKNTAETKNTEITKEGFIETKKEIKTSSTERLNNDKIPFTKQITPPKNNNSSIKDLLTPKEEVNISLKNNKVDKTRISPNTKPKIEKIYEAGEIVVLQFEFQNVSGVNTKKVESWIEFPEWIDVSSVETISYSPGIDVKTTIKTKYNTVIWLAHGNFSGEITSLSSKGMIEYRFKLNESKTQTEINSIKPEIK